MAGINLPRSAASELPGLLDSLEIGRLIGELQATRWTGRPGYPIRTMVGLALAKSLYAIPTWTKTIYVVGGDGRGTQRCEARLSLVVSREPPSPEVC